MVVVSDGADRSGLDPARFARAGVRVHAVAVGEDDLRDDAIAEVQADPIGFLRRPARVRVVVRSLGGPGGPIPVTLRRGEQVEREVVAEVPANGEAEVEIPFTPTRLGREVYRVTIPRVPGDAVPENDERAFLVRVTRDKLRVLLVAGQPSWDERFLRTFLKRDPATDLISFFILRNTSDLTMADQDELALIPFPTDELFNEHLGSFDLVIFQNFEYGPLPDGQLPAAHPRLRAARRLVRDDRRPHLLPLGRLRRHAHRRDPAGRAAARGRAADAHRGHRSVRAAHRARARAPPAARPPARSRAERRRVGAARAAHRSERGHPRAARRVGAARAPAAPHGERGGAAGLGARHGRPRPHARAHDGHELALGHHHGRAHG
ncbi:MAG: hypothetical protein M5U28_09280 [Sandaracinaceae bacterium]|nr:hypothetical protein [Sandaracinaceae bacterium]